MLIETLGWVGSVLLVVSLAQPRIQRLHSLNIVAAVLLVAYNAFIGADSGIALNIGVIAVNVWRLVRLHQSKLPDVPTLQTHGVDPFQIPGHSDSVNFDQIKEHHRLVQKDINPTQNVPKWLDTPGFPAIHGRESRGGHPSCEGTPPTLPVDA